MTLATTSIQTTSAVFGWMAQQTFSANISSGVGAKPTCKKKQNHEEVKWSSHNDEAWSSDSVFSLVDEINSLIDRKEKALHFAPASDEVCLRLEKTYMCSIILPLYAIDLLNIEEWTYVSLTFDKNKVSVENGIEVVRAYLRTPYRYHIAYELKLISRRQSAYRFRQKQRYSDALFSPEGSSDSNDGNQFISGRHTVTGIIISKWKPSVRIVRADRKELYRINIQLPDQTIATGTLPALLENAGVGDEISLSGSFYTRGGSLHYRYPRSES